MTSLTPKTSVGVNSRKYKRNQSCMVHGTSEIGYVFPTYARNYINDATINIGTRTGVRLSPLFVPTMGKLDVRHYHCFVPFNRVFAPFDAFLAREPFNFTSSSRIPDVLPSFNVGELLHDLMAIDSLPADGSPRGSLWNSGGMSPADWIQSGRFNVGLTCSIYVADDDNGYPGEYSLVDWNKDQTHNSIMHELLVVAPISLFPDNGMIPDCSQIVPTMLRTTRGDWFVSCRKQTTDYGWYAEPNGLSEIGDGSVNHVISDYLSSISYPSIDSCDLSYEVRNPDGEFGKWYMVCFNFNGAIKRLRSIMMGLGYSFNPFDVEPDTPLKLFAFYRAWYSMFGVTRNTNFNDTNCAWIYRFFSSYYIGSSKILTNNQPQLDVRFLAFIRDLFDLTYTCPSDYFTSAVQDTQQGVSNDAAYINAGLTGDSDIVGARSSGSLSASVPLVTSGSTYYVSALGMQLANHLLRWVNKNTVVGRKIADILYARYGKTKTDDDSSEGVYRVGVDTTNIEIGVIFNQTSSEGSAPLGEFSGVGSGGSRAQSHTFNTPSYGVFITLTAVVPEMGYFQGKLRENSDGLRDSFEFPDSAFDAVGWQTVRYNELVADRQFARYGFPLSHSTSLGNYGHQPRYTHYKCGFNRALGDISLPHMANSMLSYTLDRYFNPRDKNLPINDPVTARRATLGGTNRIFEVVSPTDDHIIYQIYFDISVNDRLKPLGLSYDTILEGDNKSVDFGHE